MRFSSRNTGPDGADWHAHPIDWPTTPEGIAAAAAKTAKPAQPASLLQRPELIDAKVRLHRKLIDELNLSNLEKLSRSDLRQQVYGLISDYVFSERIPLNTRELGDFVDEVMDELTGLGPIEPFLKDPT